MTEDERPTTGTVQIALRISPELRQRVKDAAEANNRSVNSELIATLEEKYPPPLPSFAETKLRFLEGLLRDMSSKDQEDEETGKQVRIIVRMIDEEQAKLKRFHIDNPEASRRYEMYLRKKPKG